MVKEISRTEVSRAIESTKRNVPLEELRGCLIVGLIRIANTVYAPGKFEYALSYALDTLGIRGVVLRTYCGEVMKRYYQERAVEAKKRQRQRTQGGQARTSAKEGRDTNPQDEFNF